jgi:hypothetical protein
MPAPIHNERRTDLDPETPNVELDVVRPADLVVLRAKFYNYALSGAGTEAAKLVRRGGASAVDCIMRVKFPPQCFDERVFSSVLSPDGVPVSPLVGNARNVGDNGVLVSPLDGEVTPVAGNNTRLDFLIPSEQFEIALPKGIDGLLAFMRQWPLVLPSAARPDHPSASEPAPTGITDPYVAEDVTLNTHSHPQLERHIPIVGAATRIELPFDLFLAPNARTRWVHAPQPVSRPGSDGRTWVELWHTRLGVERPGDPSSTPNESPGTPDLSVRAIWTESPETPDPRDAERVLNATARTQIVHQTSDFSLATTRSIPLERLYLSALGAWFKMSVTFRTDFISLGAWSHLSSQGRDERARTATMGHLVPGGHRSVLEEVTERALNASVDGERYGVLIKKRILHILEPRRTFVSGLLRSVTVLEQTISDVVLGSPLGSASARQINQKGSPFLFHMILEDSRSHSVAVQGALFFVQGNDSGPIVDTYNKTLLAERQFLADGRAFTFAESADANVETATLLTQALTLKAVQLADQNPGFAPAIEAATAIVPSIQHLTGLQEPVTILLREPVTEAAVLPLTCFADLAVPDGPQGTSFKKILHPIALPTDKSGGLAAPQLSVAALSLQTGPVLGNDSGTMESLVGATLPPDPSKLYKSVLEQTKILGAVTLDQLVAPLASRLTLAQFPAIKTTTDPATGALTSRFVWQPTLDPALKVKVGEATLSALDGAPPTLRLDASIETQVKPTATPSYQSQGIIRNLRLGLLGSPDQPLVTINFAKLEFVARSDQRPSVSITLGDPAVGFAGNLDFLQTLVDASKALRSLLGDGAFVDVKPDQIVAGYAIALPQVTLGVFSLQHIDFRAAVTLPFNGDPLTFRLSVAERAHPFNVTCTIFGGGGFFALETSTTDITLLEGAIEFGGSFELDIGVASGGIFAFAGIYIRYAGKALTVDGYFRCGGHVEVLHIISISIEFNLTLGYEKGKFSGSATLLVTVSIAFFSQTVGLSIHRSFGTGSGDPTFKDVVSLEQWRSYAEAFA